jgi:hypothetical protein
MTTKPRPGQSIVQTAFIRAGQTPFATGVPDEPDYSVVAPSNSGAFLSASALVARTIPSL